jgi:hypothetical protein
MRSSGRMPGRLNEPLESRFFFSPMIAPPVVADGGDAALVQTKFRATSSSVTSSAGRL